jgi:hypothetical protein
LELTPKLLFYCENVALSLRDRKAELQNSVDKTFGCPVAERQGYVFGYAALFVGLSELVLPNFVDLIYTLRDIRQQIGRDVWCLSQ